MNAQTFQLWRSLERKFKEQQDKDALMAVGDGAWTKVITPLVADEMEPVFAVVYQGAEPVEFYSMTFAEGVEMVKVWAIEDGRSVNRFIVRTKAEHLAILDEIFYKV